MKRIIVAIDGYSSCGKSTMAKDLAEKTGYLYCDSGAMYRAIAYYCLQNGLIKEDGIDIDTLKQKIESLHITFVTDTATQKQQTYLNGKNIEREIRSLKVSQAVSRVATLGFVREAMVEQQRKMGEAKGLVMDGRDIGTTVFPRAELKIFVTASARIRAERRYQELKAKGEIALFEDILSNVEQRDYIDEHREISPLRKADDAITLDNGSLTREQQNEWLYQEFIKRISE